MIKQKYPSVKTLEDKIALCRVVRGGFAFLATVFFVMLFASFFFFDLPKQKTAFHISVSSCMLMGIISSATAAYAHKHLKDALAKLYDKLVF